MKKIIIICGLLILLTFILNYKHNNNIESFVETTVATVSYTVKSYNGRLAVFYDKNITPQEIYNIQTNTLPPNDAEKLQSGITVTSKEELLKIISDYTG